MTLARDVDELIDLLLALQFLALRPANPTRRVVLFGNGGGTSVLATDLFAELGLDISPFPPAARARLDALGLPPGNILTNPVDTPVRTLQERQGGVAGDILDIIYEEAEPDAVVMHLNLASFVGRGDHDPVDALIKAGLRVQNDFPGQAHFLLALRVDGSPQLEEAKRRYRQLALEAGIPVFDELRNVARALAGISHLERRFAVM